MTDPIPAHTGELIASRYRLKRHVGAGAHGEVWEADDEVAKRPVAVKLLRSSRADWLARGQREATALRRRFPGVVALLDDGLDDGRAFVVMEYIDGLPFPGRPIPCSWADIADLVMKLVETLSFIHLAFFIHRDLKPANVLITRDGDLKILDFGLVRVATDDSDGPLTNDEETDLMGTPAYAAPEQVRGETTEQSDLYALGVMLYQALSGRLPHEGALYQILAAKFRHRAKPLADVAPEVPPAVARVIDALLEAEPKRRPASAAEVLCLLRGQAPEEQPFPWLGPNTPITALVNAARARRSIDVVGPSGSGRTRCLLAMAQVLELNDRRELVFLPPGERAFSSLAPVVGALAEQAEAGLAEVAALVDERVRAALASGLVIVVDDVEWIDRASARSIERCRDAGTVVRALRSDSVAEPSQDRVALEPIREEDLRSLFQGPDRLLHLREDAARLLHRRTGGAPARVVAEVDTWLRLGKVRWSRNLLVVSREMLDQPDLALVSAETGEGDLHGLPEPLADTLVWSALAWPHASADLLARMMGDARYRVEADIDELLSRGLLRQSDGGSVAPRFPVAVRVRWPEERLRAAHLAVARALPAGAAGRLEHLLFTADSSEEVRLEIGAEAAALAEKLIDEGRPAKAVSNIESGIRSLRRLVGAAQALRLRLYELWVEAAIEEKTPHALDKVIFALCREPRWPAIEQLEALARAAHAQDWTERPLSLASSIEPFASARLSRVHNAVRVSAARRVADDRVEEALLAEIEASADSADPRLRDWLDTWWGRLRYRQSRFREAADLHIRVAERTALPLLRIYSMTTAAWSLLEDFALKEAGRFAAAAREHAARQRHVYHETTASWMERTIAYRAERAGEADQELLEATPFVGARQVEGIVFFNEAAVAFRARDPEAPRIARHAYNVLSAFGEPMSAMLMRCLMFVLGEAPLGEEVAAFCKLAREPLLAGIGLQALGLMAMAGCLPAGAVDDALIEHLLAPIPEQFRGVRMDILSADESVRAIRTADNR
jgi:eukaryotic-like serine/threonine-protein kinase